MKVLVLDFGGTNLKYAIMNENYELFDKNSVTAPKNNRDEFNETVKNIYNQYKDDINGVAISYAGRIDTTTGYAYHGGSYQFIKEENLKDYFEELFDCKVTIMNDAECALLGEHEIGNLKGIKNAVAIIIGTGIGGSILINDQIYHGSHFNSGEFSSIILDSNDKQLTRFWFVRNGYKALTDTYSKIKNLDYTINGIQFFENLDEDKMQLLKQFCKDMAVVIYNFQCIFDVEKILIGGGISQQNILIDMIQQEVNQQFESLKMFQVIQPQVVSCKYANDANLIGACVRFFKI